MARRIRIDGQKLIAQYLKLSVRQVRKLARITVPAEQRLPTFTLSVSTSKNVRLYAWMDELDAWQNRRADAAFYATDDD